MVNNREHMFEVLERVVMLYINSILLGIGLAMDAFSVSLVNGLGEPKMKNRKMCLIAGVFAVFQFMMPMIGWICVHTVVTYFEAFRTAVPWIALILLCYIGGKMIFEGIRPGSDTEEHSEILSFRTLILQGIATSIDALSVGFTIAEYGALQAFAASVIIGVVTYFICMAGLFIGRRAGTALAGKASIFGGVILIAIGIEIFFG